MTGVAGVSSTPSTWNGLADSVLWTVLGQTQSSIRSPRMESHRHPTATQTSQGETGDDEIFTVPTAYAGQPSTTSTAVWRHGKDAENSAFSVSAHDTLRKEECHCRSVTTAFPMPTIWALWDFGIQWYRTGHLLMPSLKSLLNLQGVESLTLDETTETVYQGGGLPNEKAGQNSHLSR